MIHFFRSLENHLRGDKENSQARRFRKNKAAVRENSTRFLVADNIYVSLGIGTSVDYSA